MSKKYSSYSKVTPSVSAPVTEPLKEMLEYHGPSAASTLAKWIPLICAGAAVGVSVIALKEIKSVRKEVISMKKESPKSLDKELISKIESMDEQIRKITEYLGNKNTKKEKEKKSKKGKVIINESPENNLSNVNVINAAEPGVEYEEVEVTESESEES